MEEHKRVSKAPPALKPEQLQFYRFPILGISVRLHAFLMFCRLKENWKSTHFFSSNDLEDLPSHMHFLGIQLDFSQML